LWAVLITVGEPKLDDKDACKLYYILTNNGWSESNIHYLREEQATKGEILSVSDWLNNHGVEEDDLVLFYFSMHGGKTDDVRPLDEPDDKDEFIVPYKQNENDENILDEELTPMFEAIQTEKLVIIIESCYSGGMLDGADDLKKTGRIVITSTDVNETSYPYYLLFSERDGYMLIHYLLEGLRGTAEENNDGYVSVEEAYEYAKIHTIERSMFFACVLLPFHKTLENHTQNPQMYDGWPSEENNEEELKLISIGGGSNNPPTKPICSYDKDNNEITVSSTDPDGDKIIYGFSWNNTGIVDHWGPGGYAKSGIKVTITCRDNNGTIGVIAKDEHGAQSPWTSVDIKRKGKSYPILAKLSELLPNIFQILRFLPKL
jgi:hypothetical protein